MIMRALLRDLACTTLFFEATDRAAHVGCLQPNRTHSATLRRRNQIRSLPEVRPHDFHRANVVHVPQHGILRGISTAFSPPHRCKRTVSTPELLLEGRFW